MIDISGLDLSGNFDLPKKINKQAKASQNPTDSKIHKIGSNISSMMKPISDRIGQSVADSEKKISEMQSSVSIPKSDSICSATINMERKEPSNVQRAAYIDREKNKIHNIDWDFRGDDPREKFEGEVQPGKLIKAFYNEVNSKYEVKKEDQERLKNDDLDSFELCFNEGASPEFKKKVGQHDWGRSSTFVTLLVGRPTRRFGQQLRLSF